MSELRIAQSTDRRAPSQADLAAFLAEAAEASSLGLSRRPLPAVLDTDFVRTGLHFQLSNGEPPRSIRSAQDGALRLFMEHDTLVETGEKLPRFAEQFGVTVPDLRRILDEEWLPNIDVVQLPPGLRSLDSRALRVRDGDGISLGDEHDFPAAALATLLSPCLLLTHNYKHFGALGVRSRSQGVDGVMAVLAINVGQIQLQAAIWLPVLPLRIAGAAMDWATEKIGPLAWVILGVVVAGGIYWYLKQPPERRDQIRSGAAQAATRVLQEYGKAAETVDQARLQLQASLVPGPADRTSASAILRKLALSAEPLSAGQLANLLDPSERPSAADIRSFLRANDNGLFRQVRRGGFVLGSKYQLPC